jgi:predicted dienelactone hydrolase
VFECQLYNAPKTINNLPISNGNLADPRVKAVIAINPLTSIIFGQQRMGQIKIPTMLISGSDDKFTPSVPEQIYSFTWLTTPNKYLFLLQGGTHFSFLGDDDAQSGLPVPPDLIGPDPKLAGPSLKAVSTAFSRSYLLNQKQSLPYLNQSYVQTLVPQPFGVSFIKSLTSNQLQQALVAGSAKPATP